ncbi:flavin reductase (DIM6/NTAB) family NADH-FMN oxidoreductase RutF [Thermocatellispora tengchongensis]|uniref:Flavin reductase (DIM6/NTAB) family NADH-FMN oxidoreductase RutF n=2 Tax=Thermocatellispora tengchongensis TaxID=1073253 RepID=A0A840PH51_9ACTN|nr:flavin reductase (DIM6/NTAB) family NADH-FMN oxidoreductase RutF [Thermocatellispora tengchongensis]
MKNHYRQVLGQYPTGVSAVTARGADGTPFGLTVGSFTSVSMDPPIVGFLPAKSSTSWPKVRATGAFCVNVLAYDQEHVCRALSAKVEDKFAGLGWRPGPTGSPVLEGVLAWIDCRIRSVVEAGDHFIVLGDVVDLQLGSPSLPLVFFRGGYGRFSPGPLVAESVQNSGMLRLVNAVRDQMQMLSAELGVEASATGIVGGRPVLVASTWSPFSDRAAVRAGDRVPFRPPLAVPIAAWGTREQREEWLANAGPALEPDQRKRLEDILDATRERGWAISVRPDPPEHAISRMIEANDRLDEIGLGRFHPAAGTLGTRGIDARNLSAPIFAPDGSVVMSLSVSGMSSPQAGGRIEDVAGRLVEAAREAERVTYGGIR